MIQQAIKTNTAQPVILVAVKGRKEYEQQVNKLAQLAWQVCYTALWNGTDFSAIEKETAINFIRSFIQQGNSPAKAYSEFTQRVLLARQYIITHPDTYAPVPSKWFTTSNKNGFAGTEKWFDTLQSVRFSIPEFRIYLKAFGEAIAEVTTTKSARDFHYWRTYFAERNCHSVLSLYLSTIANCMMQ